MYQRKRDERERLGLFLATDVERMFGLGTGWCRDHEDQFPRRYQHGARLCYSQADVDRIRAYITVPQPNVQTVKRDELIEQGWFSTRAAAQYFGIPQITWRKALEEGRVPRPGHRRGAHWYYSRSEAAEIAEQFRRGRKPENHLSLRDMARRLRMRADTLSYHLQRWPDLGTRVGKRRRWYTEKDFEVVAQRMAARKPQERVRPAGTLTTAEVAVRFGMTVKQFRNRWTYLKLNLGRRVGGRLYFTLSEVAQVRRAFGLPVVVPML